MGHCSSFISNQHNTNNRIWLARWNASGKWLFIVAQYHNNYNVRWVVFCGLTFSYTIWIPFYSPPDVWEKSKEPRERERKKEREREKIMPLIVATYICHAARLQRWTGSARTSLGPTWSRVRKTWSCNQR